MNTKANNGEGRLRGGESMKESPHGLRVIARAESETRRLVAADDGLRELLDWFKQPFDSQRQSSDDEFPPAA